MAGPPGAICEFGGTGEIGGTGTTAEPAPTPTTSIETAKPKEEIPVTRRPPGGVCCGG